MRRHRHRFRVIYGDTDMMGVVYYANYFRYFEAGRGAFFRAAGVDYREIEAAGIIVPVASASAKYYAPAHYDDELTIDVAVTEVGFSRLRFQYEIVRESDATRIATGETAHAFLSRTKGLVRIPDDLRAILKEDNEAS
jgi:acyl-CoA thioester hydrolase